MSKLEKINKFMEVGSKLLTYFIAIVFLLIVFATLYHAIIYPQKIADKTKLGMSKQQIEQVYQDNNYFYDDHLIVCSIGCEQNLFIENNTDTSKVVEYMVVSTGIDGVFIIGFDKDAMVIFATDGQT